MVREQVEALQQVGASSRTGTGETVWGEGSVRTHPDRKRWVRVYTGDQQLIQSPVSLYSRLVPNPHKEEGMLKEGDPIPDVTLETHDGRKIRLKDRGGRRLLVWYYPKADTPG